MLAMKEQIVETARYLAAKDMAEAGAGNISIRIDQPFAPKSQPVLLPFQTGPGLKIMVTRSGTMFRKASPHDVGTVEVSDDGARYRHDFQNGAPTTELFTHLLCHAALKGQRDSAIVHAHLTNLVAISHIFDNEADVNKALYCHTEMPILIPNGIGLVPLVAPGSLEIARQTEKKVIDGKKVIIWAAHGVVAIGESLDHCVNLIEAVEKASEIALKVKMADGQIKQVLL